MASLVSLLLNPKNLLIIALSAALAATWIAYDVQKHKAMRCAGELALCEGSLENTRSALAGANGIIEGLKANLAGIRRQMEKWRQIATESAEFSRRILEAAESRKDCEVYHAENARLVDEFVDGFNGRVRGKVVRPGAAGDRAAPEILPAPGSADAPASDR